MTPKHPIGCGRKGFVDSQKITPCIQDELRNQNGIHRGANTPLQAREIGLQAPPARRGLHGMRLLNGSLKPSRGKRGRKGEYDSPELQKALKTLRLRSGQLCGKRLKPTMPHWLKHYEKHFGPLSSKCRGTVLLAVLFHLSWKSPPHPDVAVMLTAVSITATSCGGFRSVPGSNSKGFGRACRDPRPETAPCFSSSRRSSVKRPKFYVEPFVFPESLTAAPAF
ncbi:hypothetical protein PDESU_05518 [Pontiella desulfatans]|uniref:Uncharacterized protein n=1 Tax=Pontiella desulfatans TaxID=2750659 RepID=A0A6C2UAA7_PONDE|nr:hypothetical protein PDESU_05518 [Pontiella desulfatans]